MNKTFISVPTKLLALIIATLLIISAGFSLMSLSRLQQEFYQFQQETLKRGQVQFEVHNSILQSQLLVWLESFTDLTYLKEQQNFQTLVASLDRQFDALQLYHNVENVWFYGPGKELLYSSTHLPDYLETSIAAVFQSQQPQYELHCQHVCEQLVVLPVLNGKSEVGILAMTASLVDMLYAINQVLKSGVAVVSFSKGRNKVTQSVQVISSSDIDLVHQLFIEADTAQQLDKIEQDGIQVRLSEQSYLINFMPLAVNQEQKFYLVLIDDVTSIIEENSRYRQQFLFSALFIFISLLLMFYFIARPFTRRLLALSNALPLLAKREFKQFRQIRLKRHSIFSDELDVLSESAAAMSYELEQLDMEIEQKTKELENIAMHDLLTGLPNRNMLNYQLRKMMANMADMHGGVAVLFLDLDDFKKVNDSHGHGEGDNLLVEASNRIRAAIGANDLVCRFGGDEFVVVLSGIPSVKDAMKVALEILGEFKIPIKMGTSIFYISVSIGIAFSEDEAIRADDLISFADIAMYEAKANGGGQFYIHHNEMYQKVAHRVELEAEVRQALAKQQFSLSLQPQLLAKNKRLYGFEALLRWQHPQRGMVPPDDFIPLLENSEHMIELGYWIIRHCFEIMVKLHEFGLRDIRIAINLTAGQFIDPNLPHYLLGLLKEFSLPASSFELELTEQTLVKDIDHTIEMMEMLKHIGFSFAIDDFGTGYSSLAYLKQMPVDVIKIDKSFVFGMLDNKADYQIIMSTIAMVKRLELMVVAEGVESSAQLRSLTHNSCDLIQGYYFSKPIPERELFEFLSTHITDGYWKTQVKCAG